ncbi:M3 family metallopeptidase [Oleiharenicola lentus]|uniref:M3 family metallopeptidase n=1 Tax=Oleiharenicola lentus TaxID=2508720 RepID=UPI003F671156
MHNPFLERSFHIRWSELSAEHVVPAVEFALADAEQKIDVITQLAPGNVTYQNTFLALEKATELLNETWAKVSHLTTVADSAALRDANNVMLPKVSAFYARIPLNAELWLRIKQASGQPAVAQLAGEHRRFVNETLADFRQQGADLPADKKARLEALQGELAQLTQKYSENVLDATNAWELIITDEHRLAGLPLHARESARQSALKKGFGSEAAPAWRFTLPMPSQEPVMLYAEDASLRQQVWQAATQVGVQAPHDNRELVRRILALRQEKAELLGQPHFADLTLARRMAKNGAQALAFIEGLHDRVQLAFARECRELEAFKSEQLKTPLSPLAPWETGFWAERLRRTRYDFNEEQLRPYFSLSGVLTGMFEITRRVFGITVTEQPAGKVEVWHPEVKFYEVRDRVGRHIGSFYTDWHPRETKRGGAWMNYLVTGGKHHGTRAPHLGLMCGNMTPSVDGKPALLTHREVETVFHEFGHLLHHLFGEVEIKSLNGVNVAWDFVELPSQIMENWCWERESLDLFARHHETGERIPDALFERLVAAKNFRSAVATMRQLTFARLDLALHLRAQDFADGDISEKLKKVLSSYLVPTDPPAPTMENRFTHIFADPTGYAAGYYSYKWAEVLDADAFMRFKREGIFSEKVGTEFVEKILSRGNSADPMELFVDFMGRPPDQQALLTRAGLL